MDRITSIAEAKAKMQKSVDYYASRIEAWKKVERLYKKDGKPFTVLSKNFKGATFVKKSYYYNQEELTVYFKDAYGYQNDYINVYTEKDTPDTIEQAIKNQIANYEAWKEKDEKGLADIERQLEAIKPLLDELNKAINEAKETNTNYTMQGYIKYCLGIL